MAHSVHVLFAQGKAKAREIREKHKKKRKKKMEKGREKEQRTEQEWKEKEKREYNKRLVHSVEKSTRKIFSI